MKHLKTYEDNNTDKIIDILNYSSLLNNQQAKLEMSENFNNIVMIMKFKIGTLKHFINKSSINGKHKIMVLPIGHKQPSLYGYMKDEEFDKLKDLEISLSANKYNI